MGSSTASNTLFQSIQASGMPPKLMLFDLDLGGHHGSYIQHLIEYWCSNHLPGSMDIVVRPEFFDIHTDPVDLVVRAQLSTLNFISITRDEADSLNKGKSSFERFTRNFRRWKLFCKYAKQLSVTHALHLYFDTYELPSALGTKAPCPFSGIYFRPTFHYDEFAGYTPSWQTKLQQIKEKVILNRVFQHPQLQTLFCLDPFAVNHLKKFSDKVDVAHLPDPVQLYTLSSSTSDNLRQTLGIQTNRQIFLLFGALDGRKGIDQLLDSMTLLPDKECETLCLLLAGGTRLEEQVRIRTQVADICREKPVQIVEDYRFIAEAEVPAYFDIADVVLAPYQGHVGMSGILLLAAAAGKPVLSSNYGLMGELVRRYQLGLAIDSTAPQEIAKALSKCLQELPETLGDRTQMRTFAEQNSVDQYTRTIFQHLYPAHNSSKASTAEIII